MKNFMKTSLAVALSAMAVITVSCSKDEDESYVDSYSPTLTEAKGTAYTANDYFPLVKNNSYMYSANLVITGTETTNGTKETINEKDTSYSYAYVKGKEKVTFESGTKEVITYYNNGDEVYYQINDNGIVCVGQKSNGSIIEFKNNTVFLKKSLEVGDSWPYNPTDDYSELFSSWGVSASDMKYTAKIFVVGKESFKLNDTSVTALRMDQVIEFSVNMSESENGVSYKITMSMKMTAPNYYAKGVGLVKQKVDATIKMEMSASGNGRSASASVEANIKGTNELSYFSKGLTSKKSSVEPGSNVFSVIQGMKAQLLEKCKKNIK
ncbi:MAG TPA: hypothetical protein PK252_13820 [Bacteroidales bacterium]|nr:hypothetical protein [Bacteroidales bacterium]